MRHGSLHHPPRYTAYPLAVLCPCPREVSSIQLQSQRRRIWHSFQHPCLGSVKYARLKTDRIRIRDAMVKSSTKRAFALLLRTEIAIDQSPEGTSYNDGACSYKSSTLFCSKCLFGPHIYLADTRNTYTLNTRSLLDTMVAIKSLALLALAQLTLARPSPPSPPPAFQVTRLNTFEPTGRPEDHSPYRVGFNVTDPSDAAATFCETRWPYAEYNTGYPHDYVRTLTSSQANSSILLMRSNLACELHNSCWDDRSGVGVQVRRLCDLL